MIVVENYSWEGTTAVLGHVKLERLMRHFHVTALRVLDELWEVNQPVGSRLYSTINSHVAFQLDNLLLLHLSDSLVA